VSGGTKFSFGKNWLSYSERALDESKIAAAREAFRNLTRGVSMQGVRFLDIGFGQGLSLFLAAEAGAETYGIDPDPICAEALEATHRFFHSTPFPRISIASILDRGFVQKQLESGGFDVVHSWGVLHHTGDMEKAFGNAAVVLKPGGFLIISIYNRHWTSPLWRAVKWSFNHIPRFAQEAMVFVLYPVFYFRARSLFGHDGSITTRGMDIGYDIRDWLGGYPYEYASRHDVERAFSELGLVMIRCEPTRGFTGCNEFVFQKKAH
jgi:SAM-dependent methyltransferase